MCTGGCFVPVGETDCLNNQWSGPRPKHQKPEVDAQTQTSVCVGRRVVVVMKNGDTMSVCVVQVYNTMSLCVAQLFDTMSLCVVQVYQAALDIRQVVFGGKNLHVAIAHEDLAYSSYVHEYSTGKFTDARYDKSNR